MREQAGRQQLRWRQRRRRCPMKMCRGRLKVDKDGRRGEDGGGRGDERAGDTLPALCADAAAPQGRGERVGRRRARFGAMGQGSASRAETARLAATAHATPRRARERE